MICLAPNGVCPLADGECASECYIARCERPHAPTPARDWRDELDEILAKANTPPQDAPITDDDLLGEFAELVLKVNATRGIA